MSNTCRVRHAGSTRASFRLPEKQLCGCGSNPCVFGYTHQVNGFAKHVLWIRPMFSQILATCSGFRCVVWEDSKHEKCFDVEPIKWKIAAVQAMKATRGWPTRIFAAVSTWKRGGRRGHHDFKSGCVGTMTTSCNSGWPLELTLLLKASILLALLSEHEIHQHPPRNIVTLFRELTHGNPPKQ